MRILIVTPYAPPHIGGIETIVEIEIRELVAMGHEVRVITSDVGSPGSLCPSRDILHGAVLYRLPVFNFMEKRSGVCWPVFKLSLLSALVKHLRWCEAVHVHGHMFMTTPFSLLIARILGKKPILSVHGLGVWSPSRVTCIIQTIMSHTIGRFSFLITLGITLQNPAHTKRLRALGAKESKITLLKNPLQPSLFHAPSVQEKAAARAAMGWNNDRKKVLFVGKITTAKGCDLLMNIRDVDYDVVLCGDNAGPFEKYKIPEGITLLHARPHHFMLQLYHAADLLVLPSRAECQPMVICEALLCGLPAVVGRYEGAENLLDYRHIFLADHTVDSLKSAIKTALAEHGNQAADLKKPLLTDHLPTEKEWVEKIVEMLKPTPKEPCAS